VKKSPQGTSDHWYCFALAEEGTEVQDDASARAMACSCSFGVSNGVMATASETKKYPRRRMW
jgi:hypothetical protein